MLKGKLTVGAIDSDFESLATAVALNGGYEIHSTARVFNSPKTQFNCIKFLWACHVNHR
jgi:hypothetical protein